MTNFMRSVRGDGRHDYTFPLNHSAELSATVPVAGEGTDLLTGRAVAGEIELAPLVVVIQRAR
ncbi:Beta-galactosidase C-terminal domain [Nonomuraea sp. NPDC005983]|uniref:Beta-galactosidase C-terminal domain n=1 Tax=Nonomuraea sp. NPDC005983 TaxID=3155595 RepID=UPI0033A07675